MILLSCYIRQEMTMMTRWVYVGQIGRKTGCVMRVTPSRASTCLQLINLFIESKRFVYQMYKSQK